MIFRIRYLPGLYEPAQVALVDAASESEAHAKLRRDYRVRRVLKTSTRCTAIVTQRHGFKRHGYEPVSHRCYRFSQGPLCPSHAKKEG